MMRARLGFLTVLCLTAISCGDGDDGSPLERDEQASTDGGTAPGVGADASVAKDSGLLGASDAAVQGARTDATVPGGSNASGRDAGSARDAAVPPARDVPMASGPSKGCGKASADPAGKFSAHSIRVADADRSYQVFVPEGYQPTRRYPVVFRFHGRTGNGLSGGLDLQYEAPKDVIVVAPDGLNTTWSMGMADIAMFDALVSAVGEQYCVDLGRMFAYGFSAGAGFTELLSCIRGNTLRGVAAIEGYDWGRGKTCEGQVAAWLLHDVSDTSAPIAGGRAARDRLLQQNGCGTETEPAGDACVRYRGCADGQPVVWCETDGMGHNIRGDYAPKEVWKFFSTLL